MRRNPVYLLLDCSGSMYGEAIEAVKQGLQTLVLALRKDPSALECTCLSIITFASQATQVVPLTDLISFQIPAISASGSTSLGAALSLLCQCAQREIVKNTSETKGDYRPLVFIMTDGEPTDDWMSGLKDFQQMKWGVTVCCAAGPGSNLEVLNQISPESVIQLQTADIDSISAFFKWVSSSIAVSSTKISEGSGELTGINQLPPPPAEITIP